MAAPVFAVRCTPHGSGLGVPDLRQDKVDVANRDISTKTASAVSGLLHRVSDMANDYATIRMYQELIVKMVRSTLFYGDIYEFDSGASCRAINVNNGIYFVYNNK
jgi:hypothetical protein